MNTQSATPPLVVGAALLMAVAGIIHLVIVPIHYAHAPAHGLFFAISGVAQIALGLMIWRRPSTGWYSAATITAGGLIVLWGITRLYQAPFSVGPEGVDGWGIFCKITEGVAMLALILLLFQETVSRTGVLAAWRFTGLLVGAALLVGGLTYGVAHAIAPALPGLMEPAHAEHEEESTHDAHDGEGDVDGGEAAHEDAHGEDEHQETPAAHSEDHTD